MRQRKQIYFDFDKEDEKTAFLMLDKARYYQSLFIAKLVNDFFKSANLDLSSDYYEIKQTVKDYINGKYSARNVLSANIPAPDSQDHMSDIVKTMQGQQQMMQLMLQNLLLNNQLSSTPATPMNNQFPMTSERNVINSQRNADETAAVNNHDTPSMIQNEPVIHTTHEDGLNDTIQGNFEDVVEDEDEDDADAFMMAQSISSLLK